MGGAQCLKGAASRFLFGGSGTGSIGIVSVNTDNQRGAWLNRSGRQSNLNPLFSWLDVCLQRPLTSGLRRGQTGPAAIQLSFRWPRKDGQGLLQVRRCCMGCTDVHMRTLTHGRAGCSQPLWAFSSSLQETGAAGARSSARISPPCPRGSLEPPNLSHPASLCCSYVRFANLPTPVLHPSSPPTVSL